MNALNFLLHSDPPIRWQVLRDLTEADAKTIAAERARIATTGWGAKILKAQSPRGNWTKGADKSDKSGMITVHTLTLLKDFGIDPSDKKVGRAFERIRKYFRWHYHIGGSYHDGETEPCINGRVLGTSAYFGMPCKKLLERLLSEQLSDGGWNCEAPKSTCSSFHTTICVLEGLLEFEKANGRSARVTTARKRAEEYLLSRRLLRSLRTGEIIENSFTHFQFPTSYHYDVLRALDYFREAGAKPDQRMSEAIEIVKKRRHQNGIWPLNRIDPRRFTMDMEPGVGKRSQWNTLRALRVLKWYEKDK